MVEDGMVVIRSLLRTYRVTDLSAGRYYLVVTGVEGVYDDVHAYRLNATHLGSGKS